MLFRSVLMNRDNTVRCAGGFIVQVMPFVEERVLRQLEENIGAMRSVTDMLDGGHSPEEMLSGVLSGMEVEITDTMPAGFACSCSERRIEKALISIGKSEIEDMIRDGKPIEVKCHFCNTAYTFSVEKLGQILEKQNAVLG